MNQDDLNNAASEFDMTDEMKNMFDEAKGAALTQSERASMRNDMQLFLAEHPAQAPLSIRAADAFSDIYERLSTVRFAPARGILSAAFALVFVVGIGTSYAAESAVPGSTLYPIKIYFNESLRGSIARSEAAQATWNTEIVTRRLEEAEQLAVAGKLTPEARAELQSAIAISAAEFNENVAKLEKADDSAQVAQVQSDLEATLAGHQQVLSVLAAEKDSTLGPILAAVTVRKNAAASGRSDAETRVGNQASARTKIAAETSKTNTRETIRQANAKIAAAKQQNATTLSARTSLKAAEDTAAQGEAKLQAGAYGEAFKTLQAASRAAESAEVHVDAETRLNAQFVSFVPASAATTTTATSTAATSTSATSTSQ